MIQIISDWSDVEVEIDRVAKMPTRAMTKKLDAVLDFGFTLTQSAVHVESGALKASGKQQSDRDKTTHTWSGEISYGEDTGPVDYAIYEQRRGVHWVGDSAGKGDHNFLRPLTVLGPLFVGAILEGLGK